MLYRLAWQHELRTSHRVTTFNRQRRDMGDQEGEGAVNDGELPARLVRRIRGRVRL
jgi:hypothetical protein